MASDFSITFLGTRGSLPVSGPDHRQVGGATSCLVVRAGDRELIFDAGSGLLEHSDTVMADYARQGGPLVSNIFLTHCHLDHIIGLPYFGPMYVPDSRVRIWGPRSTHFESLEAALRQFIHPPFFPVPLFEMDAQLSFSDFSAPDSVLFPADRSGPVQVRPSADPEAAETQVDLRVDTLRGYNHPRSGVNHYRIRFQDKTVVYATDTEAYPRGDRRLIEFSQGADVLIHDAMYTDEEYLGQAPTQGYGHSTVADATDVARRAGVDTLFLFHHAPSHDDARLEAMEDDARTHFDGAKLARDGFEYTL